MNIAVYLIKLGVKILISIALSYIIQFRKMINDIQNRHEMFLSQEKSITDIHDMFLGIAQRIEIQGEMDNRIGIWINFSRYHLNTLVQINPPKIEIFMMFTLVNK